MGAALPVKSPNGLKLIIAPGASRGKKYTPHQPGTG